MCVFRSAKEAEDKIKEALKKGEVLPTEARFDSNCITPGMVKSVPCVPFATLASLTPSIPTHYNIYLRYYKINIYSSEVC